MNWLNGFKGRVETDAPLGPLTWFRLGGPARWLVSPSSAEELAETFHRANDHGLPVRILGGGANVLISDGGFDGLVIRLDHPAFTQTRFDGDVVQAGAGVDLMRLTQACALRGLAGMEAMAGIPGTVGGAIRSNAGGHDFEFGRVVEEAALVNRDGRVEIVGRDGLVFGYRSSNVGTRIVMSAKLRLAAADPNETTQRFKEYWSRKKQSQPLGDNSAGCIFKNPRGHSAGALIDGAGLKGLCSGGASVSAKHANFVVTGPGATSADVLAVIHQVRGEVARRWSVELELEIDVW